MRRLFLGSVLLAFASGFAAGARADDAALSKKRKEAIDKGVVWLKKAQATDGSFDYGDGPFRLPVHMKQGATALAALALMKSGVAPDDAAINKAFDFIHSCQLEHTYSVGCVLLALEARANWEPPREDESAEAPGETGEHKGKAGAAKKFKLAPRDLDLARRCVEFLVKVQTPDGSWSYPGIVQADRTDVSNTQYALLGLDAAERLGVSVPKNVYERNADYFVTNQEKEGPEVPAFPVPGGDMSYGALKKIEKELHDKVKAAKSADEKRAVEEDAARKVLGTTEKRAALHARGWEYTYPPKKDEPGTGEKPGAPGSGERPGAGGGGGGGRRGGRGGRGWQREVTGSMTTAGLACLFICKAHLDGTKGYERSKAAIDTALRDGAAWVAKHFSVTSNPGQGGGAGGGFRVRAGHLLYFLYGLERAGVLLLAPRFGEHDWYDEGSKSLVEKQQADGSWDAGDDGTVGPMCDTCFALLFLARGTTPIIRIPTRTATGPGSGKG